MFNCKAYFLFSFSLWLYLEGKLNFTFFILVKEELCRVSQKKSNCKNSSSTSIFGIHGISKALESCFQLDLKVPTLP